MDERAALGLVGDLVEAAGDDAAFVDGSVLTIDMLHESTDFPAGTTRFTAGWRAVGASLSDLAAMGASAIATVAVYGAPQFEEDELTDFIEGAQAVSRGADARYVGGDLDEHAEFTVATAGIGRADRQIGRDGAHPGDVLCVTGTLGRTGAAIRSFRAGDHEQANDLFQFQPRVAAGQRLAERATAMMDSSDGLARSLHQLGAASGVGFEVDGASVPVADSLSAMAESGDDALETALTYGEDFELVCTMSAGAVDDARAELEVPLTEIGEVTQEATGVSVDGEPLEDAGFTHGT